MVNYATAIPLTADGSELLWGYPRAVLRAPTVQVTLGPGAGDLEWPSLNPQRSC